MHLLFSGSQTSQSDSGAARRHHADHDEDNWLALNAFIDASKLKFFFASGMQEAEQFQGIWPLDAPFTRVPRRRQALTSTPSWLDWGLVSETLECPCRISWRDVPADHAWVLWDLKLQFRRHPKRPPTTWRCEDVGIFMRALAAKPVDLTSPVSALSSLSAHGFLRRPHWSRAAQSREGTLAHQAAAPFPQSSRH
jgi:hypothetical protein